MFNFLKGTDTLESDLRTWALEDCMRVMAPSEREEWKEHYAKRDLKDVAEEVASKCITEIQQAEMFMKMNGTPPNLKDNWRFTKGTQLVRDVAKRKGWTVNFEGSPAFGFRCTIS